MANKVIPLKEITISELYNSSIKVTYEIPIYQRNYAWESDEIMALIQDVYDAYKKKTNAYYIGTLVTFHKGDNVYEVIDGQQRLTTIYLILQALGIGIGNKLTYKARTKSNDTIMHIPDFDIDEKDIGIVNGFKYTQIAIDTIVDNKEEYKRYFESNVSIIHYNVPRDIDLNHYFEIMNSRGEQLEKHEIIKAWLLSALQDSRDRSKLNHIWECCSEMGVYVQQRYNDTSIFGKSMCILKCKSFDDIQITNNKEQNRIKICDIINSDGSEENKRPGDIIEKPDTFQPIIDFPNFLLIVLKITYMDAESSFNYKDFILDDKELINEFPRTCSSDFVKKFAFNLLKAKFLLDNYIVHHANEDDTMESNPWKLQYWQKDEGNKKGYLKNVSEDKNLQNKLAHLLSMFEVSFTARQRKNYLVYCLLYLFDKYDNQHNNGNFLNDYCNFVEMLADKYFFEVYMDANKLNNINTPLPMSFDDTMINSGKLFSNVLKNKALKDFNTIYGDGISKSRGVALFVFNYMDYKLWDIYATVLRGGNAKEGSRERTEFFEMLGCTDFGLDVFDRFYFSRTRRSLEHYYPQANIGSTVNEDQINCFGNYAMIGSEANSSGSNWSPKSKLDHYLDSSGKIKQISVASLKFIIMMQICRDNQEKRINPEWQFSDIQVHQEKMLNILFK